MKKSIKLFAMLLCLGLCSFASAQVTSLSFEKKHLYSTSRYGYRDTFELNVTVNPSNIQATIRCIEVTNSEHLTINRQGTSNSFVINTEGYGDLMQYKTFTDYIFVAEAEGQTDTCFVTGANSYRKTLKIPLRFCDANFFYDRSNCNFQCLNSEIATAQKVVRSSAYGYDSLIIIKPIAIGTTTIISYFPNTTIVLDSVVVNVVSEGVVDFRLSKRQIYMNALGFDDLAVEVLPKGSWSGYVNWSSNNTAICNVDDNHTAYKKDSLPVRVASNGTIGMNYIHASADFVLEDGNCSVKDSCLVYIVIGANASNHFSINKNVIYLKQGQSEDLITTSFVGTNPVVRWTSTDSTVAKVNQLGNVSGLKIGSAVITATNMEDNKKAFCEVIVTDGITLSGSRVDTVYVLDTVYLNSNNVRSQNTNANFSISPNPTTDFVHLDLSKMQGLVDVSIINPQGNIIFEQKLAGGLNHPVSLNGLASGIYVVNVNGQKSKLIVK